VNATALTNREPKNAGFQESDLTGTVFRNAVAFGANSIAVKGLSKEVKYLKNKGAKGL